MLQLELSPISLELLGEIKLGFNGDLYQESGADVVMTTKGDLVRFDSERERYGIGSAGQVLQVASSLPTWATINLADSVLTTQGDVLYEGASALARLGQSTDNFTLATKGAGANPSWQASSTSTMSGAMDILYSSAANTLARLAAGTAGKFLTTQGTGSAPTWTNPTLSFIVSLTAEDGDLTVADDLAQIRMPFAFTLTEVRAFCNVAPTGAKLIFDIEESGSTILSTLLDIDISEKSSETAATPPVISDTALADDAIISFNCDQIGSSTAGAGGKIMLIGYQTV